MLLYYKHVECSGAVQKLVVCEHCQETYQYTLTRGAAMDVMPPLGFLVRQAVETCRERTEKQLAEGAEPVSCPKCGWLQTEMAIELRYRFLKMMRTAGIVFICACLAALPLMGMVVIAMRAENLTMGLNQMEALGMALTFLAGVPLGMLMIYVRFLLAKLRYPASAFKPRRPISAVLDNLGPLPEAA